MKEKQRQARHFVFDFWISVILQFAVYSFLDILLKPKNLFVFSSQFWLDMFLMQVQETYYNGLTSFLCEALNGPLGKARHVPPSTTFVVAGEIKGQIFQSRQLFQR